MEILVLTPEFFPVYGGVGNYVLQISRNMPDNVNMHIVTPNRPSVSGGDAVEPMDLPKNVEVIHLGEAVDTFYHNFSFQWNCARNVPRLVSEKGIDLVHSQSAMPDFLISPRRLKAPILTTIHTTIEGHIDSLRGSNTSFSEMTSGEKFAVRFSPILKTLENQYYNNSRNYLTVSEWARNDIIARKGIDSARIRTIYIGVDSERFDPQKRVEAAKMLPNLAMHECPKILFLSRMATRKGISSLIRAMPKVLKKVDVHFIFGGAGRRPSFGGRENDYSYLGYVPANLPPYLYAIADVFILPSLYENSPACILEAMSSGCATIATNVCGIPEMIEDKKNGVLIPPNDVDAIARSIVELVDNERTRKDIARKAREDVVKRFNWRDTSTQTSEYYEEIITRYRGEGLRIQ